MRVRRLQLLFPVQSSFRVDATNHREQRIRFNLDVDIIKAERDHERGDLAPDLAVNQLREDLMDLASQVRRYRKVLIAKSGIVAGHHEPARFCYSFQLGQRSLGSFQPLQKVLGPNDIKTCVGERQRKYVRALKGKVSNILAAGNSLGKVQVLLPQIHADHFNLRKRARNQPRHRSGAAARIKYTIIGRHWQVLQMALNFRESRLQFQTFALFIAVNDIG